MEGGGRFGGPAFFVAHPSASEARLARAVRRARAYAQTHTDAWTCVRANTARVKPPLPKHARARARAPPFPPPWIGISARHEQGRAAVSAGLVMRPLPRSAARRASGGGAAGDLQRRVLQSAVPPHRHRRLKDEHSNLRSPPAPSYLPPPGEGGGGGGALERVALGIVKAECRKVNGGRNRGGGGVASSTMPSTVWGRTVRRGFLRGENQRRRKGKSVNGKEKLVRRPNCRLPRAAGSRTRKLPTWPGGAEHLPARVGSVG